MTVTYPNTCTTNYNSLQTPIHVQQNLHNLSNLPPSLHHVSIQSPTGPTSINTAVSNISSVNMTQGLKTNTNFMTSDLYPQTFSNLQGLTSNKIQMNSKNVILHNEMTSKSHYMNQVLPQTKIPIINLSSQIAQQLNDLKKEQENLNLKLRINSPQVTIRDDKTQKTHSIETSANFNAKQTINQINTIKNTTKFQSEKTTKATITGNSKTQIDKIENDTPTQNQSFNSNIIKPEISLSTTLPIITADGLLYYTNPTSIAGKPTFETKFENCNEKSNPHIASKVARNKPKIFGGTTCTNNTSIHTCLNKKSGTRKRSYEDQEFTETTSIDHNSQEKIYIKSKTYFSAEKVINNNLTTSISTDSHLSENYSNSSDNNSNSQSPKEKLEKNSNSSGEDSSPSSEEILSASPTSDLPNSDPTSGHESDVMSSVEAISVQPIFHQPTTKSLNIANFGIAQFFYNRRLYLVK